MAKTVTTPRTLVRNTFANLVMLMSNAIISFLLIRFFLGCFGESRYGIWVLIGSVFRYRMVLGMGLNSAINRRIPMYLARDDEEGIRKVVSTALFFFSIMAGVLVLVTIVLALKMGDWFMIDPPLLREARLLMLVVGFGFTVSTPLQLTTAVLSGLQRYDMVSIVTIIAMTLRTIVTVVLLLRGYGLVTLGLIYGISDIAARGAQHLLARRLLPKGYASWQYVDRLLLKEMLFYDLDTRDDQTRVKLIAFLTQKYSLLILIPAAAFLIVMGHNFLTVWMAKRFEDPATLQSMATILAILTVGYCLLLSQHSNYLVLSGRGEHRVFGIMTAVEAVLCVIIAVYSVKVLGLGLIGIAWSNLLPMGLVAGIILPIYFNRKMKISTWDSLRHVWWPALLGAAPGVAVIVIWKQVAPPASWAGLFGVVAAAGATTVLCGWFLGMDAAEHQRLLSVFRRGGRRPAPQPAEIISPAQ
jgi:O-antigen/teichoic acid export membrane protein